MKKALVLFVIYFTPVLFPQQLLTPEDAVKTALQNNYDILVAENNLEISDNNYFAGRAGFLPEITADGSFTKSRSTTKQEFFDGRTINRDNAGSENLNAAVALNWTIFDGLRMFAYLSRYKELKHSGELSLKNEIETNISSLFSAYYNIVRQQKILKLVEYNITLSEERLRIERDKKEVGSASGFDLRRAQVDLNEDKAMYLREELRLVQYKLLLKNLMGVKDTETDFTVSDSIPLRTDFDFEELSAAAERNNSVLQLASVNKNIAELEAGISRSELYPSISLFTGYSFVKSEADAGILKSNQSNGYNYGIRASWNIFNGLNTRRNIENAEILIENSSLLYEQTIAAVKSDLQNAFKVFENSIKQMNLELQNLKSAEENVDIALERLKLGNISPLEFREAQTDRLDAQNRLVSSQVEAKIAETDLLRISGQLIPNL